MKQHTHGEKGLRVRRYENGKIAEISEYVYLENYYDSPDDNDATPTLHFAGASLSFFKSGKLKAVEVYDEPRIRPPATADLINQRIYEDNPVWFKNFNAKGEVIQAYGHQKKLKLPMKALILLKNEGLLSVVQQFLTKPTTRALQLTPSKKGGRC